MGKGPLNHRRAGGTLNTEPSFAKASAVAEAMADESEDGHRTLNAEFKERGLQSASTFAITGRFSQSGEHDQASVLVGRVTPCAPGARRDLRTARTKSGAHGVTRPTFARVSPAAAGQTRLDFSKRGLHWRPAAPGLLLIVALPRTGRDGAPAPSAPLSGATLRVNHAKGSRDKTAPQRKYHSSFVI
jgi:hypothetical protein